MPVVWSQQLTSSLVFTWRAVTNTAANNALEICRNDNVRYCCPRKHETCRQYHGIMNDSPLQLEISNKKLAFRSPYFIALQVFNVAGKLDIVVICTFRSVFKRKLSKILDMPVREFARSRSSFTLSFDLISRHQNKRFYDIEIVWRLGSTDDTSSGQKRRPKICLRSQASEPAAFVSFLLFLFLFLFFIRRLKKS